MTSSRRVIDVRWTRAVGLKLHMPKPPKRKAVPNNVLSAARQVALSKRARARASTGRGAVGGDSSSDEDMAADMDVQGASSAASSSAGASSSSEATGMLFDVGEDANVMGSYDDPVGLAPPVRAA